MMIQKICILMLVTSIYSRNVRVSRNNSLFRNEQMIFASGFNITKLLVPADGNKFIYAKPSKIPSIFFTISDPKLEGGSCICVLEGFAAYEILEGGRDSTADYGWDATVYFGARDGIYKYNSDNLSAEKYGHFHDNIVQIQKANGIDAFYIVNDEYEMFKIEKNGTIKTKVNSIPCAVEFVLDTSNNIYYLACDDRTPHIVKTDGSIYTAGIKEELKDIKLVRPAFLMDNSIPFFGDGNLYVLYSNGTSEKKDFHLEEKPSAFSVDAALFLVAAIDGKIYEFNVMEVLWKSMFGLSVEWSWDVTQIVMSILDSTKDEQLFKKMHQKYNLTEMDEKIY